MSGFNDWYGYEIVVGDKVVDDFSAYTDAEALRKARAACATMLANAWPKSRRISLAKKLRYARLMRRTIISESGDDRVDVVGKYPFLPPKMPGYRYKPREAVYVGAKRDRGRKAARQPTHPKKKRTSRRDTSYAPRPYRHRFAVEGANGSDSMVVAVDRALNLARETRRPVRVVDAMTGRIVFQARPSAGSKARRRRSGRSLRCSAP